MRCRAKKGHVHIVLNKGKEMFNWKDKLRGCYAGGQDGKREILRVLTQWKEIMLG
jgi:hypothetical protein